MGFFDRLANGVNQAFGGADAELLASGRLGRGQILSVVPSGGTVQVMGGLVERTCDVELRVLLDDTVPYPARTRQRLPEPYLATLPGAIVAIRVDPQQPQRLAIDLRTAPPSVRIGRVTGPGSAAEILEHGTDAVAVLLSSEDCGYRDWRDWEVYRFEVTVAEGVPRPYRMSCGNAVPPEALPLLYPGARLHAKIGPQQHQVVLDLTRGPA